MTVTAQEIANSAAEKLFDSSFVRHTTGDHLRWINEGQVMAAYLKPDVSVSRNTISLVEGIYQSISTNAHAFIRPIRNMTGASGSVPGARVDVVDQDHFSLHNPDWMSATGNATVVVVMYDQADPRHFLCYPPQPESDTGYLQALEAIMPTEIAAIGDPITISDIYEQVLESYDLHRAYASEAKHAPTAQAKSQTAWNTFVTLLDRKDLIEKVIDPNTIITKKAIMG